MGRGRREGEGEGEGKGRGRGKEKEREGEGKGAGEKEKRRRVQMKAYCVHNIISEVTSHDLCCVLPSGSECFRTVHSRGGELSSTLWGKDYHRTWGHFLKTTTLPPLEDLMPPRETTRQCSSIIFRVSGVNLLMYLHVLHTSPPPILGGHQVVQ